jgi:hypothetical protein
VAPSWLSQWLVMTILFLFLQLLSLQGDFMHKRISAIMVEFQCASQRLDHPRCARLPHVSAVFQQLTVIAL